MLYLHVGLYIIIIIIIIEIYIALSSQVATQLGNGAANALKQLHVRGVKQMSFQSVSKNSHWNVWSSQLNRKTVPDARSLNGEAAIAVFGPRSGNDQLSRPCRTQVTTTSTRWRWLTVRLQILWSRTMLTLVCQNCCLENDPPSDWEPMELT